MAIMIQGPSFDLSQSMNAQQATALIIIPIVRVTDIGISTVLYAIELSFSPSLPSTIKTKTSSLIGQLKRTTN